MQRFRDELKPSAGTRILDVGGFPGTWREGSGGASIEILNRHEIDAPDPDFPAEIDLVIGDGCALDYEDDHFDVVFSNSVIEHVGSWERQQAFAAEARRCGRALWIQTPARSFFIEPHLIAPFVHYLPHALQRRLLRHCTPWGLITKPSREQVDAFLRDTRLLGHDEMRALFPDCTILRERLFGMTKSYIAVRHG